MGNAQEILSALEQLKNQLGIIEKHEVVETQNAFAYLATDLSKIENKEIAESQSKARVFLPTKQFFPVSISEAGKQFRLT
jgi:hypothetical protein